MYFFRTDSVDQALIFFFSVLAVFFVFLFFDVHSVCVSNREIIIIRTIVSVLSTSNKLLSDSSSFYAYGLLVHQRTRRQEKHSFLLDIFLSTVVHIIT